MRGTNRKFRAAVSSDWSECLSPNGPFDPISFNYPELESELASIFRRYTGNLITLSEATRTITNLLPRPFTVDQMDAYLDQLFATYTGVPGLIQWCLDHDILFMINTTGTQGYFQRVLAKGLLPPVHAVAANPMIRFPGHSEENRFAWSVLEIGDKPKNTEAVIRSLGIPASKLVVIGDSGGDGPHFRWAGAAGAHLVGSMTKHSLESYCAASGVTIHKRFGIAYGPGQIRDTEKEMTVNFVELVETIESLISKEGRP